MRYLFQGDSITDANRLNYEDPSFTGQGYVRLLEARLTFENPDTEVINCGVSGNRITDLLARWKKDCLNVKPDVLTILIGINDVIHEYAYKNGVDVELYEKIYRILLEMIKKEMPNTKIVVMTPFLIGNGSADELWEHHWDEIKADLVDLQEVVGRLANEFQVAFIDLQNVFDEAQKRAPAEHWSFDCVHPTAAGHELIARAWMEKGYGNLKNT